MARQLPRFSASAQAAKDARKLDKLIGEAEAQTTASTAGATAGGDWQRMRGLPMIGRGIGGTAPNTNPLAETIRREGQRRRYRS